MHVVLKSNSKIVNNGSRPSVLLRRSMRWRRVGDVSSGGVLLMGCPWR